jgi:superfamily I DNA/RNA helicase
VNDDIIKFDAVLIDEVQDYKSEWIRIVKHYFLQGGGEFVVFGDEKQNVYRRALGEDKRPNTTIPGAWNELDVSFRSAGPVIHLAFEYQDHFFQNRYNLDEIEIPEQEGLFAEEQRLRYLFLPPDAPVDEVFTRVREVLEEWHIHPNDVCVLSPRIEPLRDLDHLFRTVAHERTSTAFESREQWNDLQKREDSERVLKKLRNNKKLHFWMNPGTVKLSTIHSFKGWEINTLIVLIEKGADAESASDDELVYAALTRCRNNLLVINKGNPRYHEFFERHIGAC